jgi:hypothetical protein
MTESEINIIAEKAADIVTKRIEGGKIELTEKLIDLLWSAPLPKAQEDYKKELAGKTCGEIFETLL